MKPEILSSLLSTLLYEKRFFTFILFQHPFFTFFRFRFAPWFCEPIIAGLKSDNTPFLSGMDLIGAPVFSDTFVVSGTCTQNLHGTCEALYRPNLVGSKIFYLLFTC